MRYPAILEQCNSFKAFEAGHMKTSEINTFTAINIGNYSKDDP
jgi:hypothetical protein